MIYVAIVRLSVRIRKYLYLALQYPAVLAGSPSSLGIVFSDLPEFYDKTM